MIRAKVRDVMSGKVITVPPEALYKEIVETLLVYDISSVPVVDDRGKLVGIVTEADLLRKEAYPQRQRRLVGVIADALHMRGHVLIEAEGLTAEELMSTPVVTTSPDTLVREAARQMMAHRVKRLPVVSGDVLVGIVSRADILDLFDRPDTDLKGEVEGFLARCLFVPPDAHPAVSVHDGIVTLEGDVRFEADVEVAEHLVASIDGVVAVRNRLTARYPNPSRAAV